MLAAIQMGREVSIVLLRKILIKSTSKAVLVGQKSMATIKVFMM